MSTKVPSIPSVGSDNLVQVGQAIKSILDVREGVIGDPLDANVTFRDLIDAGAVTLRPGWNSRLSTSPVIPFTAEPDGYDPTKDMTPPPVPANFTATGMFACVQLQWDAPTYRNHSYTEIWRAETNVIGNAVKVGTTDTQFYVDNIGTSATRYYWVRFVSQANVTGPYNSTNGTAATTATDPGLVLASLSGQITESQLYSALATRISLIDAPSTTPGSVNARLSVVQAQVNDLLSTPTYNNSTTYATNALVTYNGAIYQATQSTTGHLPTDTAYWTKIGDYSSLGAAVAAQANQISTLTSDLAAEVSSRQTLSSAVNNPTTGLAATRSTLINDYYTKTAADSALSSAISTLSSTVNNTLTGYVTTSTLTTNYYTKTATDSAISQATTALGSTFSNTLTGYVTNAALTQSYYTKSAVDSAISSATSSLVSTTALNNALGSYTTNATLTTNYYTKTATDSAISSATSNLVSTTALNSSLSNYTTTAGLQTNYYTKTQTDSAISSANTTLQSTIYNALAGFATNASLSAEASTRASVDGGLLAQYTVKTDIAGRVAGFGLASEGTLAGSSTSVFGINADRFYVSAPADYAQENAPAGATGSVWFKPSTKQTFRYDGSAWVSFSPIIPFVVQTTPTTINGVSVPAGVYMDAAYIKDGTITSAKIGNAAIDNAKIANLDAAKITSGFIDATRIQAGSLDASKITAGTITATQIAAGSITASKIDTRGLTIKDSNGNVIFGAGTALSVANISGLGALATANTVAAGSVTGLGALATQNTVSTNQVTGLGALATANSVNWNTQIANIPSFGNFAFISSITSDNISTYIAGAAIGTAYIADASITNAKIVSLTADKILAGSIAAGQYIQSSNYSAGTTGFRLNADGSAEFGNITARGNITANSLTANTVNTSNIVGAAVTTSYAVNSSAGTLGASVDVPAGASSLIILVGGGSGVYGTSGENIAWIPDTCDLYVDYVLVVSGATSSVVWSIPDPSPGIHRIQIVRYNYSGVKSLAVLVNKR